MALLVSTMLRLVLARVLTEWSAPDSCPDHDAMEASVRALLGPDAQARGHARASVDAEGDGFTASIEVEAAGGTTRRSVHGTSCSAVADAIAVIVAVGVDPISVAHEIAQRSDAPPPLPMVPAPTPSPAIAATPADRASPRASARRRPGVRVSAWISGGAELGLLPNVLGTLEGGLAIDRATFRFVAGAHHSFARTFDHPQAPSAGATVQLTSGRVAACWAPTRATFQFPLCLGPEVGAFTARGRGLDQMDTSVRPWAAVVPEIGAVWHPARFIGLGLRGQAVVSLTRPSFAIDDFEATLVEVGAIGARLALVVELVFFDEDRPSRR